MEHFLHSVAIVIPIIFVLLYGYSAGRLKAFKSPDSIETINKLVLTFALPPTLFVGTLGVSRKQMETDFVLILALLISLLAAYFIGLLIAKFIFKRNLVEASIAGLAVAFAAGPFYGPALLGDIYSSGSAIAVSMISLVINVIIVPIATILIKIELARQAKQHTSLGAMIGQSVYQAIFKTPFVWAPLLAIILVFIGVPLTDVVRKSLMLIGQATAGIAVFVAGMTIAANKFKITREVFMFSMLKNIALPAVFFGVAISLGMNTHSQIFNEGILLAALPSGPMIVLLATRYKQYQQEASSILALTTLGMLVTVSILIALLNI